VFGIGQSLMVQRLTQSLGAAEYNRHRDNRDIERADISNLYCSSHNTWIVQPPCTSKGFHYNLTRLQLLKDSSKRLPHAKAHFARHF